MSDVSMRYKQKIIDFCDGLDPNTLKNQKDTLPRNVGYFDVYNYCILKDSAYTHQAFKAYKSLEAYQMYENGWVQSLNCKVLPNGSCIIMGRVKHSQRFSLKLLQCWLVVDKDGIVLTGHCDCMAGLGEVCRHVAAVLFTLEAWGRKSIEIQIPEGISCTDVLSKWLVPATKNIEMAKIDDIVFNTNPSKQQRSATHPLCDEEEDVEEVIDDILSQMFAKDVFCPNMAHRNRFSSQFVEKNSYELMDELRGDDDEYELNTIDLFLTNLFNPSYESLSYEELLEVAAAIQLSYTEEEIHYIEEKTREQSSCKLWYRFRAGRVTGSVFKRVCRTSIKTPAISAIESICFPERSIFKSEATEYGKANEDVARRVYVQTMQQVHPNFTLKLAGLVINNNFPFCGVSPDGIVSCDCCGNGVLEIKCPFLMKSGEMNTYMKKRDCPLIRDEMGNYSLRTTHEYYYQCQLEMFVTDSVFCDFVVWNPTISIIVRLYKDEMFWNENYPKAEKFFKCVILPELLSTHFSSKPKKKRKGK